MTRTASSWNDIGEVAAVCEEPDDAAIISLKAFVEDQTGQELVLGDSCGPAPAGVGRQCVVGHRVHHLFHPVIQDFRLYGEKVSRTPNKYDADTGQMIGEAMCWATVKSAVRQGPGEFADGLGKGIAKWVSKRLPEEELAKRQEELAAMKE